MKNIQIIIFIVLQLLVIEYLSAQRISINKTGAPPDTSAVLDISSTTYPYQGMLMPRLTSAQINSIIHPATGLMVYNTDCKNFSFYDGSSWMPLNSGSNNIPSPAGMISGTATVCAGQTSLSYDVAAIPNATNYVWTFSGSGFTITSGNGTNSITADFTGGATSGNLTVYGTNFCGTGEASDAYFVVINQLTSAPQANAASNIQQTTFTANWDTSANATDYYLDVATDMAFTSPVTGYNNRNVGNVSSFGVTVPSCETDYYYRVRASNSCGTSSNSGTITTTTALCCPCHVAGFPYRMPVALSNSTGSVQTDYQIKLTISYNAHMKSDFSDLRFRDTNCVELSYWVESYTASTSAVIWVKVPSIPTNGTHIYIYYGNAGASSNSNGPNTFCLFEDFESGLGNWSVVVTGGVPYGTTTSDKHSGSYSNYNGPSSCGANCWHSYQVEYTRTGFTLPSGTYNISFWKKEPTDWGGTLDFFVNGVSIYTECGGCNNYSNTGWYTSSCNYTGTVSTFMVQQHDLTNAETVYFDDLKIRKYASPEPGTSIEAEESCP